MKNSDKKKINIQLILPIIMLLLVTSVIVIFLVSGYEITPFILYFLIFLGAFLIYQIVRQAQFHWQIQQAAKEVEIAESLVKAGKPMEAIKKWKKVLLQLPKDQYLATLSKLEKAYEDQGMENAVQQVRAINAESIEFFEMTRKVNRISPQDRRQWQNRAFELKNMIQALPEEKGQDLSDLTSEQ
jgi:hypothetical protein